MHVRLVSLISKSGFNDVPNRMLESRGVARPEDQIIRRGKQFSRSMLSTAGESRRPGNLIRGIFFFFFFNALCYSHLEREKVRRKIDIYSEKACRFIGGMRERKRMTSFQGSGTHCPHNKKTVHSRCSGLSPLLSPSFPSSPLRVSGQLLA